MDIKCPHCGTEYEVEQKDMYRYAQCEVCGKGFVIGTTPNTATSAPAGVAVSSKAPRAAKKAGIWSHDKSHSRGVESQRKFADINASHPSSELSSKEFSIAEKIALGFCVGLVLVFVLIVFVLMAIKCNNESVSCGDDDEDYEETGSYTREPITAGEAIKGALANARARYHSRLGSLGLSEIFYDDTAGVAHLVLLGGSTTYEIVYYRSSDMLEWSQSMPKYIAADLIDDRMRIFTYETVSKGK